VSVSLLHRNPERTAWTTLWITFAVFVCLAVSVPLSVRWAVLYLTEPLPAQANPLQGTPLMWERADETARALTADLNIGEGQRIRTDESDVAMISIGPEQDSESVLATVQLFNGGELAVDELRAPRFGLSNEPFSVALTLSEGRVRVSAARPAARSLRLVVHTPQSTVVLDSGSYSIQTGEQETEIAVRYGQATVSAAGETVIVGLGERSTIEWGQAPLAPISAERNLIQNGNFEDPLEPDWQTDTYQHSEEVSPGRAEIEVRAGRRALLLSRDGQEGIHTETGISQVIDQDVQDYDVLNLQLDVRLMHQSLPGGGYLSSEFPLMVRLDYTDIYGKEQFWVQGFYFRDPAPEQNWLIMDGLKIPSFVWYPFESGNLVQLLQATPLAHLNSVRVYASGHNYESMVAEVRLIAR